GKTTGIGLWEGSYNYTWRAIDMIPKDVVICDWHYERADHTPVYFAMKGFRVITSTGRKPEISVQQAEDIAGFRRNTTREMKPRYYGIMQTVWSSTDQFIDAFYGKQPANAQAEEILRMVSRHYSQGLMRSRKRIKIPDFT
ncbi:MAG: glycoside hydrolase, partial [Bacteroidia bacterium]|nr:glycoside hydrolase [Bacteroidia bacterium]